MIVFPGKRAIIMGKVRKALGHFWENQKFPKIKYSKGGFWDFFFENLKLPKKFRSTLLNRPEIKFLESYFLEKIFGKI